MLKSRLAAESASEAKKSAIAAQRGKKRRDNQSGETFATARCIRSYVRPYVGPYVGSYTLRTVGWTIRTYAIRGGQDHHAREEHRDIRVTTD